MNKMNKNSVNLSVSSVSLCETKTIQRNYTSVTQRKYRVAQRKYK